MKFYFADYGTKHNRFRDFFPTAEEAIKAARAQWAHYTAQEKKDHTAFAAVCEASAERVQQIMEREGWDAPEDAADSIGYDYLFIAEA